MPQAGAQDFTGTAKRSGKGEESKALKAAIEVGWLGGAWRVPAWA